MLHIEDDGEGARAPDWCFKQLAAAMINQAITDAEPRAKAPSAREAWILADQETALNWLFVEPQPLQPYTLQNCCDILEIEISRVRVFTARHLAEIRIGIKQGRMAKFTPKAHKKAAL
jgi:hypothetical protein